MEGKLLFVVLTLQLALYGPGRELSLHVVDVGHELAVNHHLNVTARQRGAVFARQSRRTKVTLHVVHANKMLGPITRL